MIVVDSLKKVLSDKSQPGFRAGILATLIWSALFFIIAFWGRGSIVAIGLSGVLCGTIFFLYPILGCGLAIFYLASNFASVIPSGFTAILLFLLSIIILRKCFSGSFVWQVNTFMKLTLIFFGWALLSLLWSKDYSYFLEGSGILRICLLLFVFSECIRSKNDFLLMFISAGLGALYTGITTIDSTIKFYLSGSADELANKVTNIEKSRFFGNWDDPNIMAQSMIPIIGFLIAAIRSKLGKLLKIIAASGILAGIVAIVLSLSRGGLVCLALLTAILFFSSKHKLRLLFSIAILSAIVLMIFPLDIVDRITTLVNPSEDASINERSATIIGGLEMGFDAFPLGVGFTNFRLYSMDYVPILMINQYAHNTYLETFVELGIIGLALLLFILYICYNKVRRARILSSSSDFHHNVSNSMYAIFFSQLLGMNFLHFTGYAFSWLILLLISIFPGEFVENQNQFN